MLTRHCCRTDQTTRQGGAHSPRPVTARSNPEDVSAKEFMGALPTLQEVADFLELAASPESQPGVDRALAYATAFESPPDQIAGLLLARAWLSATPAVFPNRPAGQLRFHQVTGG